MAEGILGAVILLIGVTFATNLGGLAEWHRERDLYWTRRWWGYSKLADSLVRTSAPWAYRLMWGIWSAVGLAIIIDAVLGLI